MREQKQERNTHAKRPSPTKIATPRRAATRTHPHAVGAHTKRNAGRADPEEGVSYRPLYYTQGDLDTARNMYQIAADHMAQLLAAN